MFMYGVRRAGHTLNTRSHSGWAFAVSYAPVTSPARARGS